MGRVCCQLDYRNIPTVFLLEESVIRKTKHSLKRDSGESEEADFGGFIIPVSWFTVFPSEWVGLGFGFVFTSGRYSCICCAELLVLSVRFTKWVCFTTIAAHIPRGVAAEMVSLSCPLSFGAPVPYKFCGSSLCSMFPHTRLTPGFLCNPFVMEKPSFSEG